MCGPLATYIEDSISSTKSKNEIKLKLLIEFLSSYYLNKKRYIDEQKDITPWPQVSRKNKYIFFQMFWTERNEKIPIHKVRHDKILDNN